LNATRWMPPWSVLIVSKLGRELFESGAEAAIRWLGNMLCLGEWTWLTTQRVSWAKG
jgi:hypothetical protein